MTKNVLYITEGAKTEPLFLKSMWSKCGIGGAREIYTYETSIHCLI